MEIPLKVTCFSSIDKIFYAIGPNGKEVVCYLHNPDRDYEKMVASLGKTIYVRGSLMTQDHFVIIEILS